MNSSPVMVSFWYRYCASSSSFARFSVRMEAVRLTNQITLTILNIQEGAVRNGQLPSAKSNNKNDRFAW